MMQRQKVASIAECRRVLCVIGTLTLVAAGTAAIAPAAVTASVYVSPADPTTWTSATSAYVDGVLTVDAGSDIVSAEAFIGSDYGRVGMATIRDAGSSWDMIGGVHVGYRGDGTLNILDGATVSNASGSLGSGTATVAGPGSVWNNSEHLKVGVIGAGSLSILNSAVVNVTQDTVLRSEHNGTGEILFAEGVLNTGGLIATEAQFSGTGTINTRGLVSDVSLTFDANNGLVRQLAFDSDPDQNITINLDLTGENNGALGAGFEGVGSLRIADGLTINSGSGFLGYHHGSQGSATITGAQTTWNVLGRFWVGSHGDGSLRIEEGAAVNTGFLHAHVGYFSTGEAVVTGAGSKWTLKSQLFVGDFGNGKLRIEEGASVVGVHVQIGDGSDYEDSGEAVVTGVGTAWTNSGAFGIGTYHATGTLRIEDGASATGNRASLA